MEIAEKQDRFEGIFTTNRYKAFLLVPVILLLFSIGTLGMNYLNTGEWFPRSIELKGGTLVTVQVEGDVSFHTVEAALKNKFTSISLREISGIRGQGYLIKAESDADTDAIIKTVEDTGLRITDSSIEVVGPALGESFWRQAQLAIVFAFALMGIIVFLIFRKSIPSMMVILAAVSDMMITLAFMQILGIEISLAALAALLMLIGYSVDTDILLTSRVLKETGTISKQLTAAFKTGLTMSATTLAALLVLLITGVSVVLTQIATVLFIGLMTDIINTWLQNSVLLRWYTERRAFP